MNLKEIVNLTEWRKDTVVQAIEVGIELPKSRRVLKLKGAKSAAGYEVEESDLDDFISQFEQEEPGRHPPLLVRATLATEALHKCGICHSDAPLQFHHMIEWSEIKHFDTRHMLAVCGTCHDKIRTGQIDRKAQETYKKRLEARSGLAAQADGTAVESPANDWSRADADVGESGGTMVDVATFDVQLRIRGKMKNMPPAKLQGLVATIQQLVDSDTPLQITRIREGSVLVTLRLTAAQAERLRSAFESGELDPLDIEAYEVLTSSHATRKNRIRIVDAGHSLKRLNIEIPAAAVSERLREGVDTLAASADLPGFRRGHVPRRLVEKRFGARLLEEAKQQLVADAYRAAIDEHKLKVVSHPTSEQFAKAEIIDGKPLSVEIDVEVMPEFDLPKLDGIAIKKPTFDVNDTQVEDELKKICINEGSLEAREDAEPGDYLTGHAIMTGPKGEEFYNIDGAVVQVPPAEKNGKGMILGIMVEDFSKQLGLPKTGETVTIKAKGPEQHEIEGVRNAVLTMTFKVDRIDRIIAAEASAMVAALGFPDEAALRDAIEGRLRQRAKVQQQVAMRQQLSKHLLDSTKLDLPERLTTNQAARTLERRRIELMYRGFEVHTIEEHIAELRAASSLEAQRELKLFFILNRAAEELNVQVTENEINAMIVQLAAQQGVSEGAMHREIVRRNQLGLIVQQIREHKTMDQILAKAVITEASPE